MLIRIPFGCGLLVGVVGCLVLFRSLLGVTWSEHVWADNFDTHLLVWIFEWGYHALVEMSEPSQFWHANSFYPHAFSLASSDSLLSAQIVYSPLRWLGLPILTSIYLTFIVFLMFSVCMSDLALRRIQFSFWQRAFILFGAHFSLPMVTFFYHYQLVGFTLAPAFLLYLYLYLRDWKLRDLLFTCSLYALAVGFSTYLAPMLLTLAIAFCVLVLPRLFRRIGITGLLAHKVGWRAMVLASICAMVLFWVQLRPYLVLASDLGKNPFSGASEYSARASSLWSGFSIHSLWYNPGGYDHGGWERAYFPGYLLLSLSLAFVMVRCVTFFKRHGRTIASSTKPWEERQFLICMVGLFVCALVLSWGPYSFGLRLPFQLLGSFIPGLDSIRAPGRFGMFLGLPMAVFAVSLLSALTRKQFSRNLLLVGAFGVLVVESVPVYKVYPFAVRHESFYQSLATEMQPGTPLLDLPVVGKDNYATLKNVMNQLKGSTHHWGKMVVGYGATFTPEYHELVALDNDLHKDSAVIYRLFDYADRLAIESFAIHLSRYPESVAKAWRKAISDSDDLEVVFEKQGSVFVRNRALKKEGAIAAP